MIVSNDSYLSDFLWGESPENTRLANKLGEILGIPVSRRDKIVDIATRLSKRG
jgi:hypothetical protein